MRNRLRNLRKSLCEIITAMQINSQQSTATYLQELFSLAGKKALITGATGVLGSQLAWALARAGAQVAIAGRRAHAAEMVAQAIRQQGGEAIALTLDVNEPDRCEQARDILQKTWGTLDILVNAAGGNRPGAVVAPDQSFFDSSLDDFRAVTELNLMGTVIPCRIFGALMATQGEGVIINITSVAADRPLTRVGGYAAAKAGVLNFTRWLAVELASKHGEGLRVNAITPGFFLTEQNRQLLIRDDGSYTARGQAILAHTPFGRLGKPDELAGALIYLCSPAARFVTGDVLTVDGGFTAFAGV